jgi:hypothetical protein
LLKKFVFTREIRRKNESINEYVAQIRKLSEYCNFPDLNDTLRDRLVCGLRVEQTQKKLLSVQALTLEKAIQIPIAVETATKDAMELQGKKHESTVHQANMNRPKVDKPALSVQCYRCTLTK